MAAWLLPCPTAIDSHRLSAPTHHDVLLVRYCPFRTHFSAGRFLYPPSFWTLARPQIATRPITSALHLKASRPQLNVHSMLNKKVLLCWAGLDFLYFGAGIICLFFVCKSAAMETSHEHHAGKHREADLTYASHSSLRSAPTKSAGVDSASLR